MAHRFLSIREKKESCNTMFVTAHPDDECMFFGPAITSLTQRLRSDPSVESAGNVYLLCLSEGNAYGKGEKRREELKKSCEILGLEDKNVILHNGPPTFLDGLNKVWDSKLVADTIQFYIQKFGINEVMTFDQGGVSGHSNHKSVYHGIMQLKGERRSENVSVRFFALNSVNLFKKFSGFLYPIVDSSDMVYRADWSTRRTIQRAISAHASQYGYGFLCRLYVMFSRYLFINTFRPL